MPYEEKEGLKIPYEGTEALNILYEVTQLPHILCDVTEATLPTEQLQLRTKNSSRSSVYRRRTPGRMKQQLQNRQINRSWNLIQVTVSCQHIPTSAKTAQK
jgi:hypothetical protein